MKVNRDGNYKKELNDLIDKRKTRTQIFPNKKYKRKRINHFHQYNIDENVDNDNYTFFWEEKNNIG